MPTLLQFGIYIDAFWQPKVLGHLHRAQALPEHLRKQAVAALQENALLCIDTGWLDEPVASLLTPRERDETLLLVRKELMPNLLDDVTSTAEAWGDSTVAERLAPVLDGLAAYRKVFSEDREVLTWIAEAEADARERMADEEAQAEDWATEIWLPTPSEKASIENGIEIERSIFDDVSDGHD